MADEKAKRVSVTSVIPSVPYFDATIYGRDLVRDGRDSESILRGLALGSTNLDYRTLVTVLTHLLCEVNLEKDSRRLDERLKKSKETRQLVDQIVNVFRAAAEQTGHVTLAELMQAIKESDRGKG